MFRRRIPFNEIAVATLVGVVGGIYVYKPMFEPPMKPQPAEMQEDSKVNVATVTLPADNSTATEQSPDKSK